VEAIAKALCKNVSLTYLNLAGNNITSSYGILSEALCKNTRLTSLDLHNNRPTTLDLKLLAKALSKNTTLTDLNLNSNHISTTEGKKSIDKRAEDIKERIMIIGEVKYRKYQPNYSRQRTVLGLGQLLVAHWLQGQ
ncbi:20847_t:CDS:2, partial [Cetraspora pellucida]